MYQYFTLGVRQPRKRGGGFDKRSAVGTILRAKSHEVAGADVHWLPNDAKERTELEQVRFARIGSGGGCRARPDRRNLGGSALALEALGYGRRGWTWHGFGNVSADP
jgi:hypothetical protein